MKQIFIALCCLGLISCTSNRALLEGERLLAEGKVEAGLSVLERGLHETPDNTQVRAALNRHREAQVASLLRQGDLALTEGNLSLAEQAYRRVLQLHPENPRAPASLRAIDRHKLNQILLSDAEDALQKDEPEVARLKARTVLSRDPGHNVARELLARAEAAMHGVHGIELPQLSEFFRRLITLEFREAQLRSVFDAIARGSGINFVFDKDVRGDAKVTLFARDTAIADAIDMLLAGNQLTRKTLNENTVLIYPNIPAKHRDYQELVVKGFFLTNADAKSLLEMVRSMTRSKDLYIDEKLNLLMIRDTPEAVRLAEKIVRLADRPEPEVMLDVEILEVKRSRILELGLQWPTQFSALPSSATSPLTVADLRGLGTSSIAVNQAVLDLRQDRGNVNLLANPRIRVKNREKAKVHIGDKVPVITSNTTSTGVVSESVSYLDVGLRLDVEPSVHLDGDVGIRVGLEVSNIVREIRSNLGTLSYQLGNRQANTTLRLRDGETQILAGLISDEDRSNASGLPGLSEIPLIGRLFSSQHDERSKTEIVLLITPRVIRNIERPDLTAGEFFAGTETAVSDRFARLQSSGGMTVSGTDTNQTSTTPAASTPSAGNGLANQVDGNDANTD